MFLRRVGPRGWPVGGAPVGVPLVLHPDRVVLTYVGLVSVVARQPYRVETIERLVEATPEVKILQDGVRLQRPELLGTSQRLEVGLADQRRAVACSTQVVAHGRFALQQLRAQTPGAMLTRVFPGDDRGPCGRTSRVGTIGAIEARSLGRQPVKVRRGDLRIDATHGAEVLLIGGDQQDVRAVGQCVILACWTSENSDV